MKKVLPKKKKIAVVLFNLGAPDHLSSVKPFLRNLFLDPAIIRLPWILRAPLAIFISSLRAKKATKIYKALGGSSPLLRNTERQAQVLETKLNALRKEMTRKETTREESVRVFVAMRYWHPLSENVVKKVQEWSPDCVLLAPLYPQFSSSTTASSITRWRKYAKDKLFCETKVLCCYPTETGFVEGVCRAVKSHLARENIFKKSKPLRILFSAHGIPQKFVDQGDPYQYQIEQTVAAVVKKLDLKLSLSKSVDWRLCYQSRVGPMRWLQPYTEDEIRKAGEECRPILVVPVAFVSEHSETLYELDREYFEIAVESGVPVYLRASTVGTDKSFIGGLAHAIVRRLDDSSQSVASFEGNRFCPQKFTNCPCRPALSF